MASGLFEPADILNRCAGSTLEESKHSHAGLDLVLGTKARGVVIVRLEICYARRNLGGSHNCILRPFARLCAFLRSGEIGAGYGPSVDPHAYHQRSHGHLSVLRAVASGEILTYDDQWLAADTCLSRPGFRGHQAAGHFHDPGVFPRTNFSGSRASSDRTVALSDYWCG